MSDCSGCSRDKALSLAVFETFAVQLALAAVVKLLNLRGRLNFI